MVGAGLSRQAGVHDDAHAGDGQRRLGHRGGDDDPAAFTGRQGQVLLPVRQPPVQRADVGVHAGEPARDPGHLAHARQEDEHVAGLLGEGAPYARSDVVEEPRRQPAVVAAAYAGRQRAPDLGDRVQRRPAP